MKKKSDVHSIVFPEGTDLFSAILWSIKHDFYPIKTTIENEKLRFRIRNPKLFNSFSTKKLNNGISLIIGYY